MARKGKGKQNVQSGRVSYHSNARSLHRLLPPRPLLQIQPRKLSNPLPDWHPPYRDARRLRPVDRTHSTFSGTQSSFKPFKQIQSVYPSSLLQIQAPKRSFTCARRTIRREVLFARGRAGSGNRKPHYTQRSKVRC